jgi:acetoacetyl-CoA synthetase
VQARNGSPAASQLSDFIAFAARESGSTLDDMVALQRFAVADVGRFWTLFLRWAQPLVEGDPAPACTGADPERAAFFPNLALSYVENLLAAGDDDEPAVIARHEGRPTDVLSRARLRERVHALAAGLGELGLQPGDRVVAVLRNDAEAVVAALATLAVGATLSTVAPDLGVPAVLDRFAQLDPVLLLTHLGTGGAAIPGSLPERVAQIAAGLPSLRAIVTLEPGALPATAVPVHAMTALARDGSGFQPPRLPFDHPLFVLFSSGTTGPPKCLVHGAGGTLLEHLKEHRLHGDLRAGDRLFFQTSAAWMMWNWQLSALACGATIVLYDGPVAADTLWRIAAEERVTVLGTSPSYLQLGQDAGLSPGAELDLGALRAIQSTGSILHDHQFDWVAAHVGPQPLQSISGGTDIVGCFVLGDPDAPVRRGRSQSRSLGLDVQAVDDAGAVLEDAIGELVCRTPFPSRPLGLHGDPDGRRFHEAYFAAHPGMWTHGDLIEFAADGSARLHGRSDGVMNIRGIRIGPAELYRVLAQIEEVADAMAVEQRRPDEPEQSRLVLLVVPRTPGTVAGLASRIRRELGAALSPAHVPAVIAEVSQLPTTHSGKRSEAAARDAVAGRGAANAGALRNPESLEEIARAMAAAPAGRTRSAARGTEAILTELWEELLGVAPIAPDEDFYALGGSSLGAAELAEDVHARLGRDLPLAQLFRVPTIAGMAAALREHDATATAPVRPFAPRRRPGWQQRALERVARLLAAPAVAVYRAGLVGFETPGELLALVPGRLGMLLRRGWYASTLESCGVGLFVKTGSVITYPQSRVGDHCAIHTDCSIGWVDLGDHAMVATHVVILAGARQHGTAVDGRPMQEQPGRLERITIGEDVWIGAGAVVMADVAPHTVIVPGSTVDRTFAPYDVLNGVPARPTGSRLRR